jgi:hypothetical protein
VGALGLRAKVKIYYGLQHGQTLFVVAIEVQEGAIVILKQMWGIIWPLESF